MSNAPDPFEFVKSLWGQMGLPGYGANAGGGTGFPPPPNFDPKDLEKRLGELKQVKQWLEMNLNMMGLQINTLEMQLAAIKGFKGASDRMFSGDKAESVGGSHSPKDDPAAAPWMNPQGWMKFMQDQAAATQEAAKKAMADGAEAFEKATKSAAARKKPQGPAAKKASGGAPRSRSRKPAG